MTPSTKSHRSPCSARGSAWTLSPTRWAGLVTPTPTPHRPVFHRRSMGASQCTSRRSPAGFWSTPTSGLSLSAPWNPTRLVPPPGWPVPVGSLCHHGCWVSLWRSRVGVGSSGVVTAAPCSGKRNPGGLTGRRWLASLSRQKRKEKEGKSPYWLL